MKTLLIVTPRAKFEAKPFRRLVPKLYGWQVELRPSGSLCKTKVVPDVTLVQLNNNTEPAEVNDLVPQLVDIQAKGARRSYVLFSVKGGDKERRARSASILDQITSVMHFFPNPDRVNLTFADNYAEMAAELTQLGAKLDLPMHVGNASLSAQAPRPSPLDQVKEMVGSTEDLRLPNGKLSAERVAAAFELSINALAGMLGRSRQTVSKTPDADSLQDRLAFFERAARLRAVIPNDGFKKWLRMPNSELDDKKPLDLLANGEGQVVADLVSDMLTGAPA